MRNWMLAVGGFWLLCLLGGEALAGNNDKGFNRKTKNQMGYQIPSKHWNVKQRKYNYTGAKWVKLDKEVQFSFNDFDQPKFAHLTAPGKKKTIQDGKLEHKAKLKEEQGKGSSPTQLSKL